MNKEITAWQILEASDGRHGEVAKLLHDSWARQADRITKLTADLQEAARTLRRYEELHRAKNTSDSLAKAEANATLAARFERTLSTLR